MGSRTWIKLHCDNWLSGSISEEPPAIRGIWASLLALAGNMGDGVIVAPGNVGFTNEQMASMLKISIKMWTRAKKVFIDSGRISLSLPSRFCPSKWQSDPTFCPSRWQSDPISCPSKRQSEPIFCPSKNDPTPPIITILNWKKYQSEYERVKKPVQNIHPKNKNKNIDKEYKERFDIFWQAYPKKKSKGQAETAFYKISPDEQLLATMVATIEQAKKSDDWLKEKGKYIPYPATWLNAKGWEDEYEAKEDYNPWG